MDKCLAVDLKDPGSIPSQGDFLKEEMNQMVNKNNNKNNNSSNSLVFGRWLQTKS